MERREAQSLGDLLRQEIENSRSAPLLDELNAVNAWPKVVGRDLAAKTLRPFVKNGVMTIRVPSAPLRQELSMMRSQLIGAINAELGKEVIRELRFRG